MKKILLIVGLVLLGYTAVVMTFGNGVYPPSLMTAFAMADYDGTQLADGHVAGTNPRAEAEKVLGIQTFSGAHAQPTTACNCIPEDISESLLKMGQAVELLTDEINTTQADEIYWFNKWTESQAEIERLKLPISIHCGSNKMIVQFQQPSERGFTFIN